MDGKSLENNFKNVRAQIEVASRKTLLNSKVTLVAVSKKQSNEKIAKAIEIGQRDFGENYVQELLPRLELFPSGKWHFIGGLQRNKCKFVVGRVVLIHSVDKLELAHEISKIAERGGIIQNILLQINLGDEQTKGGAKAEDLPDLLREIQVFKGVRVKGLMALPPLFEKPEDVRPYFRKLKNLGKLVSEDCELSMGTSHDFEIAVEEGATLVRVGTSLFGPR